MLEKPQQLLAPRLLKGFTAVQLFSSSQALNLTRREACSHGHVCYMISCSMVCGC